MKLFSVAEANDVLQEVIPKLESIKDLYERLDTLRPEARAAASSANQGGGMVGGTTYVDTLYRVGKLTTEIHNLGIEIKDPTSGLIDFPSVRGERIVYLCWRLGEENVIRWWHETEAGFAGRKLL